MSSFIPSPQQAAIFEWTRYGHGSAIVEAVAGAGKTTTGIEICKIVAQATPRASGVFCAFNKSIADEIGARLRAAGIDWKQFRAATFHSLGFAAWRKVAGDGVRVNERKVEEIMERAEVPVEYRAFVASLVSLAKQQVFGVLAQIADRSAWFALVQHHDLDEKLESVQGVDPVEQGIEHAIATLKASIARDREEIDFDDMVFCPVYHDVRMWGHDWVIVDEAQDTNAARRALARKMLRPGGRLIAVGDPHQAIYGFTGADSDALDLIAQEFGAVRLPLTVTYRCPKSVVQHARQWVSHITAHDSAPHGAVLHMDRDQFAVLPEQALGRDSAVLCRNTRPLVELAFSLIRRRIPCHVEGRDIGAGLLRLARRWKTVLTVADLRARLAAHLEEQTERMLARKQETKLQALTDRVETLLVFCDMLQDDDSLDALAAEVEKVFADSPAPGITLSTIHKAKGREWDRVYWYGRARWQPSPFARQDWQQEQERNLQYVAATRAKRELIEVEVPH